LRADLEGEVPRVTRAACSRWFDEPLDQCRAALAARALAYARAQEGDLPGPLSGVKDWYIVDATTVTVRAVLLANWPGTGDDAALNVHPVLSGGCGAPVRYHFSPAREPDSRHRQIDESWRGDGLLADLASASRARLRACDAYDVRFVSRLQENWKPTVDSLARGQGTQECFPGTDLAALLEAETLVRDGRAIDAAVHRGGPKPPLHLRRVGVQTPKGSGFILTNLPPRLGALQVADLSRVRWEVERSSRLDTSVHRLDAVDTAPPWSLKTLLYAALMASTMAALLAHTHHRKTRPSQAGAPRTEAPLHPRRLALPLAVSCQSMAEACHLKGVVAKRRWEKIAAWLTHSGNDPPWRRRPSALDQLRGWKRQPVVRKKTNHRHLQAAA
jgi:hypothetical protein